MYTEVRTATESLFDRRFILNALLPVGIFGAVTIVAILAGFDALVPALRWIEERSALNQALLVAGGFAVCWMAAGILASQWRNVVRLYEGYPLLTFWERLSPLGRWECPGVRYHRSKREELNKSDVEAFYVSYCWPPEPVLPTRFGNILRSAERYPHERYGADPILLWPRLFPSLPEQFRRDYGTFVETYEFSLVISLLSLLSTNLAAWGLLLAHQPLWHFSAVVVVGWLVALAFYRSACTAATEWGEQLRSAFDLYRGELIRLYPKLATIQGDRDRFRALGDLIQLGDPGIDEDDPEAAPDDEGLN